MCAVEKVMESERKLSLDERVSRRAREYILHKEDSSPFPRLDDYIEYFRQELKLMNGNIIGRYPGICIVAAFLYRAIIASESAEKAIPIFDRMRIRTLDEYVSMLDIGKLRIIWHYNGMWEVLKKFPEKRNSKPHS